MKKIIVAITIFISVLSVQAFAEQRWIYIDLVQTPIIDKQGRQVDRPIYFAKDGSRITTGGEWIIPKEITQYPAIERYQKEDRLLICVDVPELVILPGAEISGAEAEAMKINVFGVVEKVESGATP